ncbi:MAG: cupredoxin domain-containing protein [Gaiellaceae bacterium]
MRRFAVVLLLCLAVTGTAVAGFSFAGVLSPKVTRDVTNVTVHAGEYYFTLSQTTAPAGTVVFTVINDGDVTHDFQIAGQSTPTLSKGGTATLTVNFTKAGGYPYLCSVGEHAVYGMQGVFTITGGTTTAPTTTTTTTTAGTTTTQSPTTVPVSEKEFKIGLPSTSKKVAYYKWVKVKGKRVHKKFFKVVTTLKPVKAGPVHFVVTNDGKIPHNFVIDNAQTLVIPAGGTGSVDVDLAPGKYPFQCSITGHAALGMKGTLVVQ